MRFLKEHPRSTWRAALFVNLGLEYRQTGWFLKALAAFEEAWKLSKGASDPRGKALGDRAIGELAELHARLGHVERVESLLSEIEQRPLAGSATEKVTLAREGASLMREQPERALKCGAVAVSHIRALENPSEPINRKILEVQSTKRGMSLAQVRGLARALKMDCVAAKRQPGAKVIVPSVVNWKAEHYAAVLKEENGRFLVHDPILGGDLWVTQRALDAESSGYFLVPRPHVLPKGWELVGVSDAWRVWGSGNTISHDPSGTKPNDDKAKHCPGSNGMAVYNFHLQTASLNITDTPVGYDPPVGYPMRFTATYNHREYYQPANFNYSNLGSKWTFNWLSYVQDNSTNQSADVMLYVAGGGAEFYKHFNSTTHRYDPEFQSGATLTQVSWSPIRYERTLSDGSREVFTQPDGGSSTRKVFLTERIDSAGNSVHLNYEADLRLASITDALQRVTTLSYDPPPADHYQITKVTDPFGRFAMFGYTNGKLTSITDTIGILSQFAYESGSDFINTLVTPYATTTFAHPTSQLTGDGRIIEATDQATGERERVEYGHGAPGIPNVDPNAPTVPGLQYSNNYHSYRNSFYWDKKAMALYPGDYTKARLTQWLHTADQLNASNIKERKKEPLENPVYYFYPGQSTSTWLQGTTGLTRIVAQKLSGNSSRVTSFQRNALGNVTQEIDPVGRTFNTVYWIYNSSDSGDPANMADVQEVRQTRSGNELLSSATFGSQHRRLTATDAAGQITNFSYNAFGEVLTIENPRHEITTYGYGDGSSGHPIGYLTSITGPLFNGSHPVISFTYDSANRVRTVRNDPDGYETTIDYDNLDRQTQIAYPDSTTQQFQYTDAQRGMTLDLTASKDRLNRWTYRHYNATRQMDSLTDPLSHTTLYDWCSCGSLNAITDANTNVTHFNRDVQGRLYQKVFADNRTFNYLYEGQTAPNTAGATDRLTSVTDSINQVANYQYYADDTISQISYTNPIHSTPTVNFVYDPNYRRLTSMTDGHGPTNYTYYPIGSPPVLGAGRLQSIDGPFANDTITYSYDELGRTTGQSINGVSSNVGFDSLGRLVTSDNTLGHFSRTYDGVTQRLQRLTYPNTVRADYSYFGNTGDRRLQTLQNSTSNGATTLSQFDYTYDPESEIQTLTKNLSGSQTALSLQNDAAKQLISVGTASQEFNYTYDNAANRYDVKTYIGIVLQAESLYTVNNLNQLDSVSVNGSPPVPLHYDNNGNLTDDAAGKTYEWDAANRLFAINYGASGNRTEFAYDGLGRRVKITEYGPLAGSAKTFVWSGNAIAEERDSTGATVTKRFFAEGEQRIGGTDAGKYYYTRDHLGTVREVADASGKLQAQYDYDAYGKSTLTKGKMQVDFGYTGHYFHQPSGLNLAMYRAYSPTLGRWISRDPLGNAELLQGPNLYEYVFNNPVNLTDPTGELAWFVPVAIGLLIILIIEEIHQGLHPGTSRLDDDPCESGTEAPKPGENPENPWNPAPYPKVPPREL